MKNKGIGNTNINLESLTPTEYRMATGDMKNLVIKYSLPTIIGMLVNAMYNVVDRYWVGKLPGSEGLYGLTGIGFCMTIAIIILGTAQLVGVGAAACISIRLGQRDRNAAEQILGNALTLILIFSVLVTVLGLIFCEPILRLVGAEEGTTLPPALAYIRIILAGCVFNMISFALNHPIRATGNPKRFASTQLLGAAVNMILDPILIFTFGMGIKGAAYATIFAQFVSAVWVLTYYFSSGAALRFHKKYLMPKIKIVKEIFSIGMSPFLMQVLGSVITIVSNRSLVTYGGSVAVGAFTVINSVMTLFFMPVLGINQGTQPIVGFNYGARDMKRVKEAFKWSVIYAVIITILGFVVVQSFAHYLIEIFNKDPELVAVGTAGIRIVFMVLPILGFQIPATNFFQAIGRARTAILLSLLRQVFLLIPAYLILPLFFNLTGVWMAMPFADIVSTIITFFVLRREFRLLDRETSIIFNNGDNNNISP